jgi:tRNA(fMet)-specific endonuclease VapC
MKQALIDTDTLSYFFKNIPPVTSKLNNYLAEYGFVNMSVVTYYEVMNGLIYKDAFKKLEIFEAFVKLNRIIPLTEEIAKKSATIYAKLRSSGKTIGHNDVLIAGTAITLDLVLVTNNTRHFGLIEGLEMDNWAV